MAEVITIDRATRDLLRHEVELDAGGLESLGT
jgi:hypothetical protein